MLTFIGCKALLLHLLQVRISHVYVYIALQQFLWYADTQLTSSKALQQHPLHAS